MASESLHDLREFAAEARLRIALLGIASGFEFRGSAQRGDVRADALEDRYDDPLVLNEQRQQQMEIVDEWIARFAREAHRAVQRFRALYRQTV